MPLDVPFELNSDTVQHIEGRMVINETGPLMASLDDVFSILSRGNDISSFKITI